MQIFIKGGIAIAVGKRVNNIDRYVINTELNISNLTFPPIDQFSFFNLSQNKHKHIFSSFI